MRDILKEMYYHNAMSLARYINNITMQTLLTYEAKKANKKKHRRWRAISKARKL